MLGIPNATIHSRDGEGDGIEVDTMEENDTDIIENEGINRLIHDTFVSMDENAPVDEIYEYIHDVPLIDKAQKPLYKDSKTSLLSTLLLLVNLKVLNGISNTCMTQILRYAR
jgi:hypothetical protein